jgi:hypothetical protein
MKIAHAFMHVLCDGKRKPVLGIVITGIDGDVRVSSDRRPFVILKDGQGDYGSCLEGEPDRFFQTNFRTKPMTVGELFSVTSCDPDQPAREIATTFKIVEVTPLAGHGSRGASSGSASAGLHIVRSRKA